MKKKKKLEIVESHWPVRSRKYCSVTYPSCKRLSLDYRLVKVVRHLFYS